MFSLGEERIYPPCSHAATKTCVWQTFASRLLPGHTQSGAVGTMTFTVEEYRQFKETGRPPPMSRPCVLCSRRDLQNFLLIVHSDSDKITVDPTCCYQLFRNLMDVSGGYFREYCLVPVSDRYCGFMDPVAVFRFSLLKCDASASNHRLRIDQTPMVWRGIPREVKPHLGESVADFRLRSRRSHGPRAKVLQAQPHLAQHRNQLRVHLLQPAHAPAVIAIRQLVQPLRCVTLLMNTLSLRIF